MAYSFAQRRREKKLDKEIRKIEEQQCEWNKIKKPTNVVINIFLALCSLLAVIPFIFVIIISLTDEQVLTMRCV